MFGFWFANGFYDSVFVLVLFGLTIEQFILWVCVNHFLFGSISCSASLAFMWCDRVNKWGVPEARSLSSVLSRWLHLIEIFDLPACDCIHHRENENPNDNLNVPLLIPMEKEKMRNQINLK